MMLRISQELDPTNKCATLRLEGSMNGDQISLLHRHCDELDAQSIATITLDLEGLTFLDEESGAAIRRLRENRKVALTGCGLFTLEVIDGSPNV